MKKYAVEYRFYVYRLMSSMTFKYDNIFLFLNGRTFTVLLSYVIEKPLRTPGTGTEKLTLEVQNQKKLIHKNHGQEKMKD